MRSIGEPADNAAQFVSWLESLPGEGSDGLLKGVNFAVFGCGNREWARTYQRIPTLIYQTLEKNGAARLIDRGEGDAASASFFQSFDDWEAKLWVALAEVSTFNVIAFDICLLMMWADRNMVEPRRYLQLHPRYWQIPLR